MTDAVRIAVTGMGRDDVLPAFDGFAAVEAIPTGDIDAAAMFQAGKVSYIIGVCESGGGAALAMSIAIIGADRCVNLSRLGKPAPANELPDLLDSGLRVFGIARDHVAQLVPPLVRAIARRSAATADGG